MNDTIFVCAACGKRSHDRYGERVIDRGWDVSCATHAVEVYADSVTLDQSGRVAGAKAVEAHQ